MAHGQDRKPDLGNEKPLIEGCTNSFEDVELLRDDPLDEASFDRLFSGHKLVELLITPVDESLDVPATHRK